MRQRRVATQASKVMGLISMGCLFVAMIRNSAVAACTAIWFLLVAITNTETVTDDE